MTDDRSQRPIATNRKARHQYHILDELEAGIALLGTEVKSLRAGHVSLQEAYVAVKAGELWLVGANIPEYAFGNTQNHKPTRDRKLLVRARELRKWHKQVREKGVTMIPLDIYFSGSLVKLKIGLCRGKRLYDKREAQKAKDDARDVDRALRRRR